MFSIRHSELTESDAVIQHVNVTVSTQNILLTVQLTTQAHEIQHHECLHTNSLKQSPLSSSKNSCCACYTRIFSVPLAIMVTKNSNVCQNCLLTYIKNLCSEKLRLAADYRHAKFRDDTTKFRNIKADICKTPLRPTDSCILKGHSGADGYYSLTAKYISNVSPVAAPNYYKFLS